MGHVSVAAQSDGGEKRFGIVEVDSETGRADTEAERPLLAELARTGRLTFEPTGTR